MEAFRECRIHYIDELNEPVADRVRLKFTPLKPSYQQAIQDLFALLESGGSFRAVQFQRGMLKTFVDTGTMRDPQPPREGEGGTGRPLITFKEYKEENQVGKIRLRSECVKERDVIGGINAFVDGTTARTQMMVGMAQKISPITKNM